MDLPACEGCRNAESLGSVLNLSIGVLRFRVRLGRCWRLGYTGFIAKNPGSFLLRYVSFPGVLGTRKDGLASCFGDGFPSHPVAVGDDAARYLLVSSSDLEKMLKHIQGQSAIFWLYDRASLMAPTVNIQA